MLPNLLIEGKFDTLTRVFVEALEVTPVDTDSVSVGAAHTEEGLYFTGYVLSLNDPSRPLLSILQIGVHISAEDIFRLVEEGTLLLQLRVLGHS